MTQVPHSSMPQADAAPVLALTALVHALLAHMTACGSIVAVERVYEHAQREVANGSRDAAVRAGAFEHLERIMEGSWGDHALAA